MSLSNYISIYGSLQMILVLVVGAAFTFQRRMVTMELTMGTFSKRLDVTEADVKAQQEAIHTIRETLATLVSQSTSTAKTMDEIKSLVMDLHRPRTA